MKTALLGKMVRFESSDIDLKSRLTVIPHGIVEGRVYAVSDDGFLLVQPLWMPRGGSAEHLSLAGYPLVKIEALHCAVQVVEFMTQNNCDPYRREEPQ